MARPSLLHNILVAATHTRVIVRDTRTYQDLLSWSTSPDLLVSGAAHDVALEILVARPLLTGAPAGVIDAEKQALWRRDVPHFTAGVDSRCLEACNGRTFASTLPASGLERLRLNGVLAGQTDCVWQSALLRSALAVAAERRPASTSGEEPDVRINANVMAIGNALESQALRGPWGATWLQFILLGTGGVLQQPAGFGLYDGTPGIALFLAALANRTGAERYAMLARESLEYGHRAFEAARRLGTQVRCSAFEGWVSLVYAGLGCGAELADAALVGRAADMVRSIPLDAFRAERNIDFIGGAAGAIVALLELHSYQPDDALIERCHLLAETIAQAESNAGGWKVPHANRPLLGMGHGAAGISYALARLWSATHVAEYLRAVERGLAFEASHFDGRQRDWPNVAVESDEACFMVGWCAGAAGSGLARLGILDALGTHAPRATAREIAAAIEAARACMCSDEGGDYLCCGEAGRIAFLTQAAQQLARPDLAIESRDAAVALIDRFERNGSLSLQGFTERCTVPHLLGGIAGVGMALLAATGHTGPRPLVLRVALPGA